MLWLSCIFKLLFTLYEIEHQSEWNITSTLMYNTSTMWGGRHQTFPPPVNLFMTANVLSSGDRDRFTSRLTFQEKKLWKLKIKGKQIGTPISWSLTWTLVRENWTIENNAASSCWKYRPQHWPASINTVWDNGVKLVNLVAVNGHYCYK